MKKLIIMAVGAISLALSATALAGGPDTDYPMDSSSGFYVGADAGAAIPGNLEDLDTGVSANGQVGYNFGMFRLEAAGNYIRNTVNNTNDDVHLNIITVMANGYFDFHNSSIVVPFIGAGAGWLHAWATADLDGVSFSSPSDNEFAYQGIAGLGFRATDDLTIDIRYRILSWTDGPGYMNIVEAGFNYFF